ncbi:glycosyltransferase family 4 protein [Candidatus Bathyarchaeota archaeon]|nr:glycosyltransferase family 4 protein [Candidatus Bathyarchaeota archaeon]
MKILIVCPGFTESSLIAQPWRYTYEVAKILIINGHDVSIATDGSNKNRTETKKIKNIKTFIVPTAGFFFKRMNPSKIKEILRRFSFDAIYWIGYPHIGSYIEKFKDEKCKNIVHINSNIYAFKELHLSLREYFHLSYGLYYYLNTALTKPTIRLLNQNVIGIITVPNNAIKQSLTVNGVIEEKIRVIPPRIYDKALLDSYASLDHSSTREELGFKEDDFVVTYFGPANTLRGTDIILKAVNRLKSKHVQLRLLMLIRRNDKVTTADDLYLERLSAKLNLNDVVRFVPGILSTQELAKFLRVSDLVLFPFKIVFSEPLLSLEEAMAMGKPVIGTKISGISEIISDGGLTVESGNVHELAEAIQSIMNVPTLLETLGNKAKEQAKIFGDMSAEADCINSIFGSL